MDNAIECKRRILDLKGTPAVLYAAFEKNKNVVYDLRPNGVGLPLYVMDLEY